MAHKTTKLQPGKWQVVKLSHAMQHSCSQGTGRWDNYGTRGNRAATQVLAGGIIMAHETTELQLKYWQVESLWQTRQQSCSPGTGM